MNFRSKTSTVQKFFTATCLMLVAGLANASGPHPFQIASDQKAKVKGTIESRNGDLVKVKEKKTGSVVVIDITDDTKIERKQSKVK